ncbi:MAG: phospholipid carrier-dependent glycosyltransferase [Betaproteobacteria bacterium]
MRTPSPRWLSMLYAAAALLAIVLYFFDLGGQHIPKNGDEFPYAHITRLTAASGQLLPLQSELDGMRNTKPPLIFWQGIAATNGGTEWTLWNLRYPSVIYTLLTALLCYLLTSRLTQDRRKGALAALIFLAFFTTYRFGRPFLTNAPETFWLFLPFFLLLYLPRAFDSRWLPPLIGVLVGIGLLYKSFALLLPIGTCLAWWYLHERRYQLRDFISADVWKLALVAILALGTFALWFALDPQPQAIWNEFVVGENAGKFKPGDSNYFFKLAWGASSFWTLVLGFPMNAGLLAFPVFGLMVAALRHPRALSREEKLLWALPLVMLFVFSLPSQRSARYLLDAMPAVAILSALAWDRLGRIWFLLSLIFIGLLTGLLAYLAWSVQAAQPELALFGIGYAALLAATLAGVVFAVLSPALTRPATVVAALLALLSLAGFLRPFNGLHGNYSPASIAQVAGREVWVPYDFNAKYEAYRFLLPGANIRGYVETREMDVNDLAAHYPLFAVHLPLDALPCAGCQVIGERLDLRGRHSPVELKEILRGRVFEHLFVKELLLSSPENSVKGRH